MQFLDLLLCNHLWIHVDEPDHLVITRRNRFSSIVENVFVFGDIVQEGSQRNLNDATLVALLLCFFVANKVKGLDKACFELFRIFQKGKFLVK